MTLTAPASSLLKARYPEFDSVADARVDVFISEALRNVDEGWCENDRNPAILALAAHKLALEGEPNRSISIAAGGTGVIDPLTAGRNVSMRKVGDVTTQYEASGGSSSGDGSSSGPNGANYDATTYGKFFKQLLSLNSPAIGVV